MGCSAQGRRSGARGRAAERDELADRGKKTKGQPQGWPFFYLRILILRVEPVRHLDQERVVRMRVENVLQVATELELISLAIHRAALRPHEEYCRSRTVLITQHCVGAEFPDFEAARITLSRVG